VSLLDTTLVGDILPGGPAGEVSAGSIDTTQVIDDLLPSLHSDSRANLTFWSAADLVEWMDEALKRLSKIACVFVGRSVSILTVAGQATYTLPDRHIATLHLSHVVNPLKPASTLELEMKDSAYATRASATPSHWYPDLLNGASFGIAGVPAVSDQVLPIIYEGWPPALDGGGLQTLVSAPAPLKGYLAMCVLAKAYGREGESEMPDVAHHCAARVSMYEEVFTRYYGAGM
jgi:hypothetical protein